MQANPPKAENIISSSCIVSRQMNSLLYVEFGFFVHLLNSAKTVIDGMSKTWFKIRK